MLGCVQVGPAAQSGVRQQFLSFLFFCCVLRPDSMTLMALSTDCVLTCHTFNFQPWCVSRGEGHLIKGFPFSFHSPLPNLTLHTLHCKYAVHTNPNQILSAMLTQRLRDVRLIPKYYTHINNYVTILSETLVCKSCQMSGYATNRQINKVVKINALLNPISQIDLFGLQVMCHPDRKRSWVLEF